MEQDESIITRSIRVLLIESNSEAAVLLTHFLEESAAYQCVVSHADRLTAAKVCLYEEQFEVILLNLMLVDSSGLDTIRAISDIAPRTPIIVLTEFEHEGIAARSLRELADDYVILHQIDSSLLLGSLNRVIVHDLSARKPYLEPPPATRRLDGTI